MTTLFNFLGITIMCLVVLLMAAIVIKAVFWMFSKDKEEDED